MKPSRPTFNALRTHQIGVVDVSWQALHDTLPGWNFEALMTPEQFADLRRPTIDLRPEERLLLNVGLQAFKDAYGTIRPLGLLNDTTLEWLQAHWDAHLWINSDEEGDYTFSHWCDTFGFEPNWVRRRLFTCGAQIHSLVKSMHARMGREEDE